MMITIKIGTSERRGREINERWIQDQINTQKRKGEDVCVRVKINCTGVDLTFSTENVDNMKDWKPRSYSKKEELVIDEWMKKGIPTKTVHPGMVVSFWEFAKRICR